MEILALSHQWVMSVLEDMLGYARAERLPVTERFVARALEAARKEIENEENSVAGKQASNIVEIGMFQRRKQLRPMPLIGDNFQEIRGARDLPEWVLVDHSTQLTE